MWSNMFGEVKQGEADYTVVWENVYYISTTTTKISHSW